MHATLRRKVRQSDHMTMSPHDLIAVGDFLHSADARKEHYLRAAVSRYYYAAYWALMPISAGLPAPENERAIGVHARLIARFLSFEGSDKALFHKMGKEFQRLKAARVWADYNPDDRVPAALSTESRARVLRILGWCRMAMAGAGGRSGDVS